MPAFFVPTLIALPTPSGPIVRLTGVTAYDAQFDEHGKWLNPFHISWDRRRALASHHFVESSYQLWQSLSTVIPIYPHGITAVFGIVNYHDLEAWHKTNGHTVAEQQKHLIEAFYTFRRDLQKK